MNKDKLATNQKSKGVILLEMLLALALGGAILGALIISLYVSLQGNLYSSQRISAQLYLQEASEVVRSLWQEGWANIAENGIYHPQITEGDWELADSEETDGFFTRKIEITDVRRDSSGNIVSSGGTLDPAVKKIIVTVTWNKPKYTVLTNTFYLTYYEQNYVWVEDTYDDFIDGIEDATDVTSNPGYIQLAQSGGTGNWTEPTVITHVDALAKGNGIWANDGYLYFALGQNEKKVQVFDISTDPENPASLGYFSTGSEVNNIAVFDHYLYAALADAGNGLEVFDLSPDPVHPTSIAVRSTNDKPVGLWPQNGYLFVAVDNKNKVEVYSLNVPDNPQFVSSFDTLETTTDITGSGNYLYVAQDSSFNAIGVFDISSNPTNPNFIGNIPCFYNSRGIWLESNTLYLSLSGKRAAMYSLTINPLHPQLLGIFQTEQNSRDITALGDYGYIGGTDSWSRAIGIIYVGDSKGISGIYFVYGEYISSILDLDTLASFNHLSWEGNKPTNTNIYFQIAVNNDGQTWNYVGPDGTSGTFYENPGAFPLSAVSGRFVRYKAILTGDGNVTPGVDRVIVNYSQ